MATETVISTTDPEKMSIAEKVASGYLTAAEGSAISGAELEKARMRVGIPTYSKDLISQSATEISFSPTAAAESKIREQSSLGTPGSAQYKFMSEQVSRGVPYTVALNQWASGRTTSAPITSDQAAYYENVNQLLLAGKNAREASEMAGIVTVKTPTDVQASEAQKILDIEQSRIAGNPYWANVSAFSMSEADKADARLSQEIAEKAAAEGKADRGATSAAEALAAWEAKYGSTGWAATAPLIGGLITGGNYESKEPKTYQKIPIASSSKQATQNFNLDTAKGPYTSTSYPRPYTSQVSAQEAKESAIRSTLGVGTSTGKLLATEPMSASNLLKDTSEYTRVGTSEIAVSRDGTKVKNLATNQVGRVNLSSNSIEWGSFGSKHQKRLKHKSKQAETKPKYGTGFIGMITELNKKSTKQSNPTTKKPASSKEYKVSDLWGDRVYKSCKITDHKTPAISYKYVGKKPASNKVDTWSEFALIDRKISNTKRPAVKPVYITKKSVKNEGSAWEQVLFSKPKPIKSKGGRKR